MRRCREAAWKKWLGAALVVCLLLAESFAVTHQYKAHDNGQACTVCVGVASLGAGNVAAPLVVEAAIVAPFVAVAGALVFVSVVPARRYARGPPAVSFTF